MPVSSLVKVVQKLLLDVAYARTLQEDVGGMVFRIVKYHPQLAKINKASLETVSRFLGGLSVNSINDKWREEEYKGTFSKMWECHRQLTIKVFFSEMWWGGLYLLSRVASFKDH